MGYDGEAPRAAFNRAADSIERRANENPINAWMRTVSRRELVTSFPPGSALLEIGCGAGADAVYLAERGCRVVAVDISDQMVELTRERTRTHGVADAVVSLRGRLVDLTRQLEAQPWAPFDGAYANFSLAYETSLREVGQAIHGLLRPGAHFVFTLPNKLCVSEPAVALARGRPGAVFDRFREPRWSLVRDVRVPYRAYAPAEVRRSLEGLFDLAHMRAVPAFVPPSSFYRPSWEGLRRSLQELDEHLAGSFPWRYLGDHTLFHAHRVGG